MSTIPERLSPLSVVRTPQERLLAGMVYQALYQVGPGDRSDQPLVPTLARDLPQPVTEDLTEYVIPLDATARWHDGRQFLPADVKYSWSVLADPRNEYAERGLLLAYIASITTAECGACVRVLFRRAVSPEDAAWLLRFPITSAHGVGQGGAGSPSVIHPDSARTNARTDAFLRRPIGTGPYALVSALANGSQVIGFRAQAGPAVIVRATGQALSQRTAVRNGELDVLLDPESALVESPPRGFSRLENQRTMRMALVLNPANPALSSDSRRNRVVSELRAALVSSRAFGCSGATGRLPLPLFRIATRESGPLYESARVRLRRAADCLGSTVLVARTGAAPGGALGAEFAGMLVRVGDSRTDVLAVMSALSRGAGAKLGSANQLFAEWLSTAGRTARDRTREALFREIERIGGVLYVVEQRDVVLVRSRLTGLGFGADGELGGASRWNWAPR